MAAKSKISKERWDEARRRWESNPNMTFSDLSPKLQLTRQAISKMAARQGWTRGEVAQKVASEGNVFGHIDNVTNGKVLQSVTDALIRLIDSPETPPELVFQACEKLLKLGKQL